MIREMLAAALGGAALLAASAAQARDLREVATLANGTRVLLDVDSLTKVSESSPQLRFAIVSVDYGRAWAANGRVRAGDIKVGAECEAGRIKVAWSRGFAADGTIVAGGEIASPHDLARPKSPMESAVLSAICELP